MSSIAESLPHGAASVELSVIMPAWNEEAVLPQAIDEAVTSLTELGITFELIVVDDGCTDGSERIVRNAMQGHSTVRLVQHPQNRGYGAALRSGFEASRGRLVAFTDADCQFHLSDLRELIILSQRYDIVSGYRIDRKDSPLRCFYSWGYNTLIRALLGSPLRDIDCALKVFRREALLRILPRSENFFANTEMMAEARRLGCSINEVGVTHRPRAAGTSSVSIREIPKVLNSLMPFWWQNVHFAGRASSDRRVPSLAVLSLILIIAGLLLFRGLAYPLVEPDEGRYAEIAREMLRSGDWIIPQLHHEPYLDKPPLFYWLCAGSFSFFGATDWAARLVPAIAAWLTIGMTYLFGCRVVGRISAGMGTIALSLSFGFITCGRFLILDSVLSMFVTGSLFSAYLACKRNRVTWGWWICSALSCGLGILTKGPIAFVLVTPPVVAHCWLANRRDGSRLWPYISYLLVATLTAVPWFVVASFRMPEFVRYFFWEHNVERFLSGSNHPEPFWFYIPTIFLACMPWGLLLFPLLKFLTSQSSQVCQHRSPGVGFLALWAGWVLLFFSLSSGKLPPYILPCLPAVMLLLGQYVSARYSPFAQQVHLRAKSHALFHRGTVSIASLGLLFAGSLFLIGFDNRWETLVHGSLWLTILAIILAFQKHLTPRTIYGLFCVVAFLALTKIQLDLLPTLAMQKSTFGNSTSAICKFQEKSGPLPVVCIAGDWGSVPFYLDRDDVAVLPIEEQAKIRHLLEENESVLLVMNDNLTENQRKALIPNQSQVTELSTTSKAKVLAIRTPQPIHLISAKSQRPANRSSAESLLKSANQLASKLHAGTRM